jgi:AbrB family looped-hinge helix DNA binding protein
MPESKVTSKFQVTIPKEIRNMYDLKEGDHLLFLPHGDRIILEKKQTRKLTEALPLKIKVEKVTDVHLWREMARKEAKKRVG